MSDNAPAKLPSINIVMEILNRMFKNPRPLGVRLSFTKELKEKSQSRCFVSQLKILRYKLNYVYAVCTCVKGCPSWISHGKGFPTGHGRGAEFPNPTDWRPRHSHWICTCAQSLMRPKLIWVAKGELYTHIGGNRFTLGPTAEVNVDQSPKLGLLLVDLKRVLK